jgi:GH15 family glucan-1,4-alpha-glucosidase
MSTTTRFTPLRSALVDRSVRVLLAGQSETGAFVASPGYATYRFAWLRDGSFCADALDRHGECEAAAAFHAWVCRTILAMRSTVERITVAARTAGVSSMLPTRFELDGRTESGEEDWPNFQLDGYGTWLWAFGEHVARRGHDLAEHERITVELVAGYVAAAGDRPCYDCWEESVDRRHASTLGASVAGLRAAARMLDDDSLREASAALSDILDRDFVRDGSFVKHDATDGVDASLLWLGLPFGVVKLDDPRFVRTAERVERELAVRDGGVRRYLGDTFYGGGEWVLLTAWSGWVHHAAGRPEAAYERLAWIEAQATPQLDLPEQVGVHPQDPGRVAEWVNRWGPVASPLLWSHAMYLTLVHEIGAC